LKRLKVLIVEDVESDAILLARELGRAFDVSYTRVDTAEAMSAALDAQEWDLVISDYSMPRFSGPKALALLAERKLNLPFIIVSGTVGEEIAVDSLHAGAQDFLSKNKLTRLNAAVERCLRDAELRAEKARVEEQLLISDRLASVGTLAASVAHEINNPLSALLANLEFVAEDLEALRREVEGGGARVADLLRRIEEPLRDARESSERVREIARDLKIFSRSDEKVDDAVDLRRVIESSARMARTEIRHRAQLALDLGDELPPAHRSEGRLGQVFLNLILNAAQAIPEGRASANEIRIVARAKDGRLEVEVRDTGVGIPPDELQRIFEPFFTTKPEGEGTGLGLAICHGIVAGLGGTLGVESEVGVGTVFRLVLPTAARAEPAPQPSDRSEERGAKGRILVVDDEPMILAAVQRMLSSEHEVEFATTAREAILRVMNGERFDAVVCDVMMPELTGVDLYAEFERLSAELASRVIFMSGGVFSSTAKAFLESVPNVRLEKPFDAPAIREAVRSVLR